MKLNIYNFVKGIKHLLYPIKENMVKLPNITICVLNRTYYNTGTNGVLSIPDGKNFLTIELPWRDNKKGVSCVPEGIYELKKRYSARFGHHILVDKVPGREFVLFHPANNAMAELAGCIACVEKTTAPGMGWVSAIPTKQFRDWVYDEIRKEKRVFIKIES